MGKKRACRRNNEENAIHERAVKLRKMTDEQLCEHLDNLTCQSEKKGYNEGYRACEAKGSVKEYLEVIQKSKISGIGAVTLNKLLKVAKENGYI